MALDTDAMHISGVAHVFFGDVGEAAPSDHTSAPSGTWAEIGHTSYDNGIVITPTRSTTVKRTHQAPGGVRTTVDEWYVTIAATPEQIDTTTLALYFGASDDGGNLRVPKTAPVIERALYIRSIDGTSVLPIYVPRVNVDATGDVTFSPGGFAALPVSMRTMDYESADSLMDFLLAST